LIVFLSSYCRPFGEAALHLINAIMPAGLVMALVSGRMLLLQPSNNVLDYLDFNWDVDWRKYGDLYNSATRCTVDVSQLIRSDLAFCGDMNGTALVMQYSTLDYDVPLLEVNPALASTLTRLFPKSDIFHQVATRLFGPSQLVLDALGSYNALAQRCLVGMHIRGHKPVPGVNVQAVDLAKQFADITKGIALTYPGTIFVAADVPVFATVSSMLPNRQVWWTNLTETGISQRQAAGQNPGSDLSAFVDMFLLAKCKHLLLTSGSSFGAMASGYSNVVPVYAIKGDHSNPFSNPSFWKGLTSEPPFHKYAVKERHQLAESAVQAVQAKHARAVEIEQQHP
jgi:hypothetical protein